MSLLLALQAPFPLSKNWTGFWRANYTGSPWPGETTLGPSGTRDLTEAISPPAGGAAQNGYTPADFNGTLNLLTADGTGEDYIGAATVTVHAVVWVNSAPTAATFAFEDPCIIVTQNSAIIALGVSSSGIRFGV